MGSPLLDKSIKVMLIDDHQTILWGLQQLINNHSPRMVVVGTANNVDDALAKVKELDPDIILLDMDLGRRNGLEILPDLIANSHAKVIVLTGMRDQKVLDECIVAGAKGVVRKEEPAETLVVAIEKVFAGQFWLDRDAIARVFQAMQDKDVKKNKEAEKFAALTARERNIVRAIIEESGAANKVIAEKLFMSEHTLRNHLTSIYHKLGVDNRLKLYVYALENGFSDQEIETRKRPAARR